MVPGSVIAIFLVTAGFFIISFVIGAVFNKAEAKSAELICEASVLLAEQTETRVEVPYTGTQIARGHSPILCKTLEETIKADTTGREMKYLLGDLMARCWNMYGKGTVSNPFKSSGDLYENACAVCYLVTIEPGAPEIEADEMLHSLFDVPYKVSEESNKCHQSGGYCVSSEAECKSLLGSEATYASSGITCRGEYAGRKCCYTGQSCRDKGGICAEGFYREGYRIYNDWHCSGNLNCFVEKEHVYNYGEYIQRYRGKGDVIVIGDIEPGAIYAVTYGAPTDECSYCESGELIATLAPFVVGGVLSGGPAGLLFAGARAIAFRILAAGTTNIVIDQTSKAAYDLLLKERNHHTIYLTPLSAIKTGEYCRVDVI